MIKSFISFDIESLPGRADSKHVDRLIWGRFDGGEYGIARICDILQQHRLQASFMLDLAGCELYGDAAMQAVGEYVLSRGHELHVHLHSEWLVRRWGMELGLSGPVGMDRLDAEQNQRFMDYAANKHRKLFGLEPCAFRAGGFLFNEHTVQAAEQAGFSLLSNFNAERHGNQWQVTGALAHNDYFYWSDRLLELPVDYSPEPLTSDWNIYEGWFDRARFRKQYPTFNLTLHSWSLLERQGEHFVRFAPEHEARLHKICEHLTSHTTQTTYGQFLQQQDTSQPAVSRTSTVESDSTSQSMPWWRRLLGG
ncbi:hypothetical protein [Chromobacterium sp. IIBBL 290-4]|uniref:hypothetical protein n=1 Tax=Chromobacterium sp. IIBBL 290-4 TaxID=2953890 RepID=UPI0020B68CD5|nr:hypothetical protein [Chromobacterium sp. IIBBL 290-4]UTH76248.1 hypothetical protein NKT35_09155 [Chromobacterium sp. IIBBL 290-4]